MIVRFVRWAVGWSPTADQLQRESFWESVAWLILAVAAIALGWIYSIAFVSALSLAANVLAAAARWQAARAEAAVTASEEAIREWRERALIAEGQVIELRHSVGELIETTAR